MSQTPPPSASAGTGAVGKVRSPLTVLLLGLVTLGIYSFFWYYATFKEMKEHSGEGLGGGLGLLLAIFCSIVTIFIMPSEVGNLYKRDGREQPVSAMTGFWVLIPLIGGLIWLWKVQGRLNDYWESKGATK
jgi:hypothetical protein